MKPVTLHLLLGLLKTDIVKATTEEQRNEIQERYNIDLSSCLNLTAKQMEQEANNIVDYLLETEIITVHRPIVKL